MHLFRDAPLGNPANILLKGDLLTATGLEYRRKMFRPALLFLVVIFAGFGVTIIIGAIAGLASHWLFAA